MKIKDYLIFRNEVFITWIFYMVDNSGILYKIPD